MGLVKQLSERHKILNAEMQQIFIARARGLDIDNTSDLSFTDLNDRVANYVNAIETAGIASGKTSTTFEPNANITRQEMARMLANAYRLTATSERWLH